MRCPQLIIYRSSIKASCGHGCNCVHLAESADRTIMNCLGALALCKTLADARAALEKYKSAHAVGMRTRVARIAYLRGLLRYANVTRP